MSTPNEQKKLPVIGADAEDVSQDPELMQIAMNAQMTAFVGQRDEALHRAADLFSKLSVTEALLARKTAELEDARKDITSLQANLAAAVAAPGTPAVP